MSSGQIGGAVALAVIGLLLIIISATSRDSSNNMTPFANNLSKAGIFVGGFFMLPLVLMVMVAIVVGFPAK